MGVKDFMITAAEEKTLGRFKEVKARWLFDGMVRVGLDQVENGPYYVVRVNFAPQAVKNAKGPFTIGHLITEKLEHAEGRFEWAVDEVNAALQTLAWRP